MKRRISAQKHYPLVYVILVALCSLLWVPIAAAASDAKSTVNILAINDEIKTLLDQKIRPIRGIEQRTLALHTLMFDHNALNIHYDYGKTYTAQETYEKRVGNCLSLASLFVASARYVGLKARFQSVSVPERWEAKSGYYVVPGHINVVVSGIRKKLYVEFLKTFFDDEFEQENAKVISDAAAYAEYHNNIGMEYFEKKQYLQAIAHLKTSTEYYSKNDFVWSNYGVALKFSGDIVNAENMYYKALKIKKRNFSALTNLYILLDETGRHQQAERIFNKVKRYSQRNPHHLAKLADTELRKNAPKEALKLIQKAIRKDANVPGFYALQARAYYQQGDYRNALHSFELAKDRAKDRLDINKYDEKIGYLLNNM